ncbi:MAG: hypothetical protein K6G42_02355 [Lachnospiraceae bacterium]|nr:hypothetical protein [Lachnospiraceae bacterium]
MSYDLPDSRKRHPEYTEDIIRSLYRGKTSVTVTGSKGKGSSALILSAILGTYGRVGLMTGPHIKSFNERFRVGTELISDRELADTVSALKPLFDKTAPDPSMGAFISPIGIETAVAESFFFAHDTDFDIYEHGKGVKYDDVKNIPASYAIINSVFLEHTRELGHTTEAIAEDKACIIRPGMKGIYSGWQSGPVADIIIRHADEAGVPLKLAGRDFDIDRVRFMQNGMSCSVTTKRRRYEDLEISLMGSNQCRNLAIAVAAAEDIVGDTFCVTKKEETALREALLSLEWFGRLSILRKKPLLMVDCCINPASARGALETVSELGIERAVFILAIPDDKDHLGVAKTVCDNGHDIILTKVANPHYRFKGIQQKRLTEAGIPCRYAEDLGTAIRSVGEEGRPAVILGTTAMLSELTGYLGDLF